MTRRTFALSLVMYRSAPCVVATGIRYEAGVIAFQNRYIARLVV